MIAKARAISHGGNMGRYSVNKWKAKLVKLNKIPKDLDPTTMWKLMEATQLKFRGKLNAHRPLKNTAIRIEVSPSRAQSAGWTMDDWVKLADDFVKAFDAVDLSKMAQRESAKSTNLRNSQYFAMLHEDSDSGILHLHIIASRVDLDGKVNDDHCIHERAMIAAFRVSEERRWEQPEEVREGHIKILSFDCKSALEEMESFSWEAYEDYLKAHGYGIEYRRDSNDKITGYTILWGHSRFKSSILGKNRNLTPSRIQDTWKELHPEKEFKWQPVRQAETPLPVAPKTKKYPQPKPEEEKKPVKPAIPINVRQTISVGYREYPVEVPETVYNFFKENAAVPENAADSQPHHIIQTAMLLFAGYVDGATTIADNCGGAGSSATDDWGKKKPDENDMAYAKRCLERAQQLHVRPPRRGMHL